MSIDLARLVALATALEERTEDTSRGVRARGDRRSWYRIDNAARAPKTAEVFIYDTIGDWGVTAKDFVAEVRAIKAERIDLHINSYGGQVFDGVAIYNALVNHPAHVTSIVDGVAASAASFIAMAGEEIQVEKAARMMIHDASGMVFGNAKDMRDMADLLDGISNTIAEIYADRAGGTVAEWRTRMLAETWYTANEAVSLGLANAVAGDIPLDTSDKIEIVDLTPPTPAPSPELVADHAGTIPPDWLRNALREAMSAL